MDEISAGHSLTTGDKSGPIDESFQGQVTASPFLNLTPSYLLGIVLWYG